MFHFAVFSNIFFHLPLRPQRGAERQKAPGHRRCREGEPQPSLRQSMDAVKAPSSEPSKSTLHAVMNGISSDPLKAKPSQLSSETISTLQLPLITAQVRFLSLGMRV